MKFETKSCAGVWTGKSFTYEKSWLNIYYQILHSIYIFFWILNQLLLKLFYLLVIHLFKFSFKENYVNFLPIILINNDFTFFYSFY